MIKVAMLSYWHVHAKDYAKQAQNHPQTEIIAVWDEIAERGKQKAEELGVTFYEDLDMLLANQEIDGVIVDTPTSMHRDVMVKAAQAGKHIFTEKVVATTTKEADEIVAAVNKAGVKLTVSLPRLNEGYTLAIQDVLAQGLLGQLTLVRTRLSHNGAIAGWLPDHFYNAEQCGGGAMIDLGCHPMYLARLFLGLPKQVSANYGYCTGKEVEDNAVVVLQYDNGALGIVEAGFVNAHSPFVIEVHGTEGTILYDSSSDQIKLRSNQLKETDWTIIDKQPARPSAFDQWVSHIEHDTIAEENIALALDLTKLMEASNQSDRDKQSISL